ncbi:MAG: YggT family protein [Chloroflexi bacterium]|nr:YggT family protein [Chloroflexota bacterium]
MAMLGTFIQVFITVMWAAILVRSIMSWFPGMQNTPVFHLVYQVTEPMLAPLRRILPRTGLIDLSPLVAILLLLLIQELLSQVF